MCCVFEKFCGEEETLRFVRKSRVSSLGIEINVFQVDGEQPGGQSECYREHGAHRMSFIFSCPAGPVGREVSVPRRT